MTTNEAAVTPLESRSRLSAQDWERAALEAIAEQGVNAVAVEPLARRLGVTKGSFYWHFPTREALLKAALERWEHNDEKEFVFEPMGDPRERLRELFRRASRETRANAVYSALLRALDNMAVQPVMLRVSQRRIDFLTVAYLQLGLDRVDAAYRARLVYTAYAGFLQLSLQLGLFQPSHVELDDYVEHVIATLIPA
ncbi:MAG: TetR/AcrR family transcriptional regulator [Rhodanobacteraceae bacterium]|nr:TetR/AcrR family transcriptional regulator [Rhodanobacteraceae bacterium]